MMLDHLPPRTKATESEAVVHIGDMGPNKGLMSEAIEGYNYQGPPIS